MVPVLLSYQAYYLKTRKVHEVVDKEKMRDQEAIKRRSSFFSSVFRKRMYLDDQEIDE